VSWVSVRRRSATGCVKTRRIGGRPRRAHVGTVGGVGAAEEGERRAAAKARYLVLQPWSE
jgi:hypothetical protein